MKRISFSFLLKIFCIISIMNICYVSNAQNNITIEQKSNSLFGNGINIQPSYYNSGNPECSWDFIGKFPGIKSIRIEIDPVNTPVDAIQAAKWIYKSHKLGLKIIATYHNYKANGSDNPDFVREAANWWLKNYDVLNKELIRMNSGTEVPFTINIINEWGSHNITAELYAKIYSEAITILRQKYSGYIVIDIPGFGQGIDQASRAVLGIETNGLKISDKKIVLSAHIYPNGYNMAKKKVVAKGRFRRP